MHILRKQLLPIFFIHELAQQPQGFLSYVRQYYCLLPSRTSLVREAALLAQYILELVHTEIHKAQGVGGNGAQLVDKE